MLEFILFILGLLLGGVVVYLRFKPQLTTTQKLDEETAQKNEQLKTLNQQLENAKDNLQAEYYNLKLEKARLDTQINSAIEEAEKAGSVMLEASKAKAAAEFEIAAHEMSNKYQEYEQSCKDEYLVVLQDLTSHAQKELSDLNSEREELKMAIADLEKRVAQEIQTAACAIEANKRALEESDKKNFYRIQLSNTDLEEIEKLRTIAPLLRNREPLDKVIWKCYYEKPTANLIGRVVGLEIKCGIYKITDMSTGMAYVGQSVNIADRFKSHIKAGLGIDTSNNKLYTTMREKGVENFTFEILEECNRIDLNTKERFWIEFYQSESFGMNSTKGNK